MTDSGTSSKGVSAVGADAKKNLLPRDGKMPQMPLRELILGSSRFVSDRGVLVGSGYASLTLGIFAVFRTSPFLIFLLGQRYRAVSPELDFSRSVCYFVLFLWLSVVLFVLLVLGGFVAASRRMTKRWVLLLHPFGLHLLYLDIFVWVGLSVWLHLNYALHPHLQDQMFDRVAYPLAYFTFIYLEVILMGVLYYVFATYFIAVELKIINTFF